MDTLASCICDCQSLLLSKEHDALVQQLSHLASLVIAYEQECRSRDPSDIVALVERVLHDEELAHEGVAVACDILCQVPVAACHKIKEPSMVRQPEKLDFT